MTEETTLHYVNDRRARDDFIEHALGVGAVIDIFSCDRGHAKGIEIHEVTDTGVIVIKNGVTHKVITKLIARPEQIRKLYRENSKEPPSWLIKKAYKNNAKRYNDI